MLKNKEKKNQSKIDEITADYNRRIAELRKRQVNAALAVLSALDDDEDNDNNE